MRVTPTDLPEVLAIEPEIHEDARGYFLEQWHESRYREAGIAGRFVQDNLSRSRHGALRGLHFQEPDPQGKLISVFAGQIFDVAVDIRRGSPRFAQWVGVELSADNRKQLWIPPGFAHGFCVLGEHATVSYKCTEVYVPGHERVVRWNDPALGIAWPVRAPIVSERDRLAPALDEQRVLPDFPDNGA